MDHYEQLRGQAMGTLFANGKGLGLALLMRNGMPAWMDAWAESVPEAQCERTDRSSPGQRLPSEILHQITTVLTNMVMGLQELGDPV